MYRTPQLRTLPLLLAGLFITTRASAAAPDPDPAAAPMQTVEITAAHLKDARIELSPKVGTTVYTIDSHMIDTLGQGDNTSFNEVLLRLPGVAQDSKASGSIHVRDDHANVQYRVNGVQLPESITGFGQSIDTR
ncbi:MAG TPA: TonB-dependent receptor, partial [Telluria sp.]|nr:TonB-dependent receptor [Telluria sp.]